MAVLLASLAVPLTWWKVQLTAISLTLGVAVFILISFALVIAGPALAGKVAVWMDLGPAFHGSLFATTLWLIASLGFKYYVVNISSYSATYGAIGGVMVLMLWFYISGAVILLGAEMNAEIEHASPYAIAQIWKAIRSKTLG